MLEHAGNTSKRRIVNPAHVDAKPAGFVCLPPGGLPIRRRLTTCLTMRVNYFAATTPPTVDDPVPLHPVPP